MTSFDPYTYHGQQMFGQPADTANEQPTTVRVGLRPGCQPFYPSSHHPHHHHQQQQQQPSSLNPHMLSSGGGGAGTPIYYSGSVDAWAAASSQQQMMYSSSDATTAQRYTLPPQCNYALQQLPSTRSNGSTGSNGNNEKKFVYRHNPYASDPSTPTSQNSFAMHASLSGDNLGSFEQLPLPASPVLPVYAETHQTTDASTYPMAHGIIEQFEMCIGRICEAACSSRGRSILTQVIRMQHVDKIQIIFDEMLMGLDSVASDQHGAQVLRLLVEYLPDSHISQLCLNLPKEMIVRLSTASQNTRRVLQSLFENHSTPELQYVIDVFCESLFEIATQQQGCIAVMRVMDFATEPQRQQILSHMAPNFATLAMDPFGNYVVQAALPHIDPAVLDNFIVTAFEEQWVALSCNKFGSNVMEKVVNAAGPVLRAALRRELCYNPRALHMLMQDGYGNFVLQALIDVSAGTPDGKRICDLARPLLHSSPYGHKIEAKLRSKKLLGSGYNRANQQQFVPTRNGGGGGANNNNNHHHSGHYGGSNHHVAYNNGHHHQQQQHYNGHGGYADAVQCSGGISDRSKGDNESSNASQSACEAQAQ